MLYSDVLLTIAEVAVAIAGFSSLVTVLGQRDRRAAVDIARLRSMLIYSALAVLFALFPFAVNALGGNASVGWRISSAVFGVSLIAYARWVLRIIAELKSSGAPVFATRHLVRVIIWLTILVLFLNIFVSTPDLNAGLYLLGLLAVVSVAGFMFVQVILSVVKSEHE